jgi:hypothetical protein|tara:strand:- start:196 stop:396 length:201 start_codon:yes stop_codon:yes gene_type:complete
LWRANGHQYGNNYIWNNKIIDLADCGLLSLKRPSSPAVMQRSGIAVWRSVFLAFFHIEKLTMHSVL